MTKQDKVCFMCLKKDDVELCSSCGLVYQCEDHASYHQDKRNNVCFPFKVTEDETVGKYIIAVRYILNEMKNIHNNLQKCQTRRSNTEGLSSGCGSNHKVGILSKYFILFRL